MKSKRKIRRPQYLVLTTDGPRVGCRPRIRQMVLVPLVAPLLRAIQHVKSSKPVVAKIENRTLCNKKNGNGNGGANIFRIVIFSLSLPDKYMKKTHKRGTLLSQPRNTDIR